MDKPFYILAINDGHDANCTLATKDGIILSASRERFSRKKFQGGFPCEIISFIKENHGISLSDIGQIIFSNRLNFVHRYFSKTFQSYYHDYFSISQKLYLLYQHLFRNVPYYANIMDFISSMTYKKLSDKVLFYDHHLCHAASAFFYSGLKRALVITADNIGDGLSASIYSGDKHKLSLVKAIGCLRSPGQFYGEITQIIGYDPLKHAGKTTGLAANGDPAVLYPLMEKLFYLSKNKGSFGIKSVLNPLKVAWMKKKLEGRKKEDIAAAAQKRLEDVFKELIRFYIEKTRIRDIVVSGGVFGNVKLNQHVFEMPEVENLYVHPGMSDCGLSMGALACYYMDRFNHVPSFLNNIYLGPKPGEIDKGLLDLKRYSIRDYKQSSEELCLEIANCLKKGKIIALCRDKMEYGPRALGNRSIIYNPLDRSVNDWLNKKLKRSEFMPFAPSVIHEDVNDLFYIKNSGCLSDRFMTITYNVRPVMKEKAPAVVHVDNTARPQVLHKGDNEFYYNIIKYYKDLSNVPCILNTSFNMHEEPIVMTSFDAIRAFVSADLDVLVLNDSLIEKK